MTTTQGDQWSQSEDRSMRPLSISRLMSCLCWWRGEVRRSQKRQREEQNSLLVASMDSGFFTDGNQRRMMTVRTPRGLLRFFVVRVKPSRIIWSMRVQCTCAEDQAAITETVESLNRLGYLELIVISDNEQALLAFHDAVIREPEERFWCQSNRTGSTNI